MRLTDFQKNRIVEIIHRDFGRDAEIYLFGSRTDDFKKGGDIDLLVTSEGSPEEVESRRIKSITGIQFAIGDQKIDLVVTDNPDTDSRPVVKEALKKGVRIG